MESASTVQLAAAHRLSVLRAREARGTRQLRLTGTRPRPAARRGAGQARAVQGQACCRRGWLRCEGAAGGGVASMWRDGGG
eukprot:398318-Prymnesium_polylepis.1